MSLIDADKQEPVVAHLPPGCQRHSMRTPLVDELVDDCQQLTLLCFAQRALSRKDPDSSVIGKLIELDARHAGTLSWTGVASATRPSAMLLKPCFSVKSDTPSYHEYRFPPAIVSHAVWLYHRFGVSFRDVEDLLAQRGLTVCVLEFPILLAESRIEATLRGA